MEGCSLGAAVGRTRLRWDTGSAAGALGPSPDLRTAHLQECQPAGIVARKSLEVPYQVMILYMQWRQLVLATYEPTWIGATLTDSSRSAGLVPIIMHPRP